MAASLYMDAHIPRVITLGLRRQARQERRDLPDLSHGKPGVWRERLDTGSPRKRPIPASLCGLGDLGVKNPGATSSAMASATPLDPGLRQ